MSPTPKFKISYFLFVKCSHSPCLTTTYDYWEYKGVHDCYFSCFGNAHSFQVTCKDVTADFVIPICCLVSFELTFSLLSVIHLRKLTVLTCSAAVCRMITYVSLCPRLLTDSRYDTSQGHRPRP